jgi:hypothetical protein
MMFLHACPLAANITLEHKYSRKKNMLMHGAHFDNFIDMSGTVKKLQVTGQEYKTLVQ